MTLRLYYLIFISGNFSGPFAKSSDKLTVEGLSACIKKEKKAVQLNCSHLYTLEFHFFGRDFIGCDAVEKFNL